MSVSVSQWSGVPSIVKLHGAIEKLREDNRRSTAPTIRLTWAIVGWTLVVLAQVAAVMLIRVVEQIVQV